MALMAPPAAPAGAAADPLAHAEARITAAQREADQAASDYDAAQARYYGLESDAEKGGRTVRTLKARAQRIASIARSRAVLTYMSGGSGPLDPVLGDSGSALDLARRGVLVDRV